MPRGYVPRAFVEHVAQLLKAEKEGRLVILPVKTGTPAWKIWCDDCGAGGSCIMYPNCDECDDRYMKISETTFTAAMADEIGKTVFLTREEAEAALKKEADHE